MARLKLLRFSLLTFSSLKKEKLLLFINLMIFLSLFALSTSVISMYYENKIDDLDNKIVNEETNILVYQNQIQKTPIILKNIENILNNNSYIKNYFQQLELHNNDDQIIISKRDTVFKPYWRLSAVANYGSDQINRSISDAILVSDSIEDLNEIQKIDKLFKKINSDIREINKKKDKLQAEWAIQERNDYTKVDTEDDGSTKMEYYNKFFILNEDLSKNLREQINFFVNFNLNYFSKKKIITEKKILAFEKELNENSKRESLIILIAFFLQLVIFISVQYFEISMEVPNAKRTKKK